MICPWIFNSEYMLHMIIGCFIPSSPLFLLSQFLPKNITIYFSSKLAGHRSQHHDLSASIKVRKDIFCFPESSVSLVLPSLSMAAIGDNCASSSLVDLIHKFWLHCGNMEVMKMGNNFKQSHVEPYWSSLLLHTCEPQCYRSNLSSCQQHLVWHHYRSYFVWIFMWPCSHSFLELKITFNS